MDDHCWFARILLKPPLVWKARLIEPVSLQAVLLDKRYLNQRWYISQCISRAPQLLFSNIQGSTDDVLQEFDPR